MKKIIAVLALGLFSLWNNPGEINAQSFEGGGSPCPTGGPANIYCPYWSVTYEVTQSVLGPTIKVTCTTGGNFTCETRNK